MLWMSAESQRLILLHAGASRSLSKRGGHFFDRHAYSIAFRKQLAMLDSSRATFLQLQYLSCQMKLDLPPHDALAFHHFKHMYLIEKDICRAADIVVHSGLERPGHDTSSDPGGILQVVKLCDVRITIMLAL